jgi:hemerythrin-like metal-binding protein
MSNAASAELSAIIMETPERASHCANDAGLVCWSGRFSVGIATIDDQHHGLFDLLNDLQDAVNDHRDREVVKSLLGKLIEDTQAHFAAEEALMEQTKYNGKALHTLKHQHLIEQLDVFVARYNRGFELNEHSLAFIRDWFTPHILEADANFGLWYGEHCFCYSASKES